MWVQSHGVKARCEGEAMTRVKGEPPERIQCLQYNFRWTLGLSHSSRNYRRPTTIDAKCKSAQIEARDPPRCKGRRDAYTGMAAKLQILGMR